MKIGIFKFHKIDRFIFLYIIYQLYITLPNIIVNRPQCPAPPISVKSVNWGLEHMERPNYTKFNIQACMLTPNNNTKNYRHRCTGPGTSYISKIGKLGSWAHGTSDSHKIWYVGLYNNSNKHYQKLSSSANRVRYLPYKSNR